MDSRAKDKTGEWDGRQVTVALAGNPNSGKTTLFNALTGARQHVGNYPGVTVEEKDGTAAAHSLYATTLTIFKISQRHLFDSLNRSRTCRDSCPNHSNIRSPRSILHHHRDSVA